MAKNFQGVMTAAKDARFTSADLADMQEPRPYDLKLSLIINSISNEEYQAWYQNVVNLPAAKWRAAIDEKINFLCDADKREPVTLRRLKDTAAQCGCISCTGVLEGIRSAVKWYAQSPSVHKYARKNRRHFIQSLRDVITSPTINHTGE
jgi:hypothetical protein